MTNTITLGSLVRKADTGQNTESLASAVLTEMLTNHLEMAHQLLLPVVASEIADARRIASRKTEDKAFKEAPPRKGQPCNPVAASKQLAGEYFHVPSKGLVRWDEATAEEHEERAEFQRKMGTACYEDADRHIAAAKVIRDAGANCLADIKE
jgi:hypothetical protein